jgi:MFS family permease
VYFGLCLASLALCQITFLQFSAVNALFYFMVFLIGLSTASFYGWLPLYLPELFPTRVRATGQGFAFNGGRILAAVGVLGAGQLTDTFGWAKSGAMISLVYLLGLVAIWFAPETKGKPMPE